MAADGAQRLPRPADRPRDDLRPRACGDVAQGVQRVRRSTAQLIGDLHALGIAIQGCFVFGLDHDTPDVFDETVQFAVDAGIDLPRFAILTPFPGHAAAPRGSSARAASSRSELGALRRPARRVPAAQMTPAGAAGRARAGLAATSTRYRLDRAPPCGSARAAADRGHGATSATASTRTTCTASTTATGTCRRAARRCALCAQDGRP